MSEYYKAQQKMYQHLEKIIKSCKDEKVDIDLKTLIYDITLTFAVSQKAINNRINDIVNIRDDLKLDGDKLVWVLK